MHQVISVFVFPKNYSKWHAAIVVSVMGIGDLVGCLLVGIQSVICNYDTIIFFTFMLAISGAIELVNTLATDFYVLCISAGVSAACSGKLFFRLITKKLF